MAILENLDNFFIPASGYTGCDVVDVDVDIDDAAERQKMGKKITILRLMERQKFFF